MQGAGPATQKPARCEQTHLAHGLHRDPEKQLGKFLAFSIVYTTVSSYSVYMYIYIYIPSCRWHKLSQARPRFEAMLANPPRPVLARSLQPMTGPMNIQDLAMTWPSIRGIQDSQVHVPRLFRRATSSCRGGVEQSGETTLKGVRRSLHPSYPHRL